MQKSNMNDHEFGAWLRAKDPNWTWEKVGRSNQFFAYGKLVAIAFYDNINCTRDVYLSE